jgi:hypothetical protein
MREPYNQCAGCGQSGFSDAAMSITEVGPTCPTCYVGWQQQQRQAANAQERQAANADPVRSARVHLSHCKCH